MKIAKILFSIIILFAIFGNLSPITNAEEKQNVLNQQKENLKDEKVNVQVMSESEKQNMINQENNIAKIQKFKEQMQKEGFSEIQIGNENTSLKYIGNDNNQDLYGYITNHIYKNTKTNEVVVSQTIYDNYNNKISKFVAEKKHLNQKTDGQLLINYKDDTDNQEQVTNEANNTDPKTATYGGFKFAGKSFACSMGGLYACGHFCGVWALVNPIAGGTCGAVCGTAFAAACSVTK